MKQKKKLICFDMDNTIIDATKTHIIAYKKALKNYGLKVNESKLRSLLGMEGHYLIKKLYPKLKKEEINKIMETHHKVIIKKKQKSIKGAVKSLKKLRKEYELAIVSNCRSDEIPKILRKAKINPDIFDIKIGNDSVNHPKPFPDEILKAEKLLHLKADYIVGDSIYDIIAGKRAKVKTIAVLTGNTRILILKKYKPNKILKSVADLPKFLLSKNLK